MPLTLNEGSLGAILNVQQTLDSIYMNFQNGDILGIVADVSTLAVTVATYEAQVGLSITNTGLTLAQAMDKTHQGNVSPKDVIAVSNAVLGGLAALGIVMSTPETLAAATTVAGIVGLYGWATGTTPVNKLLHGVSIMHNFISLIVLNHITKRVSHKMFIVLDVLLATNQNDFLVPFY